MFHYVTGIPFHNDMHGGAYDDLTLWEQIDDGAQYTPAKKWLLCVPIALCVRYMFLFLLLYSNSKQLPPLHSLHTLQPLGLRNKCDGTRLLPIAQAADGMCQCEPGAPITLFYTITCYLHSNILCSSTISVCASFPMTPDRVSRRQSPRISRLRDVNRRRTETSTARRNLQIPL